MNTGKYECLSQQQIVENYIRIKNRERIKNKESYEKLKENPQKYYERLNKNYIHQINYVEDNKKDEQKEQEYKARRKIINKKSYLKRKQLQQD